MFSKRKYELRDKDIPESFRYLRKYSRADCKKSGIEKRCPLYSTIAVTFRKVKLLGNKGWRKWRTFQHPVAFRLLTTEVFCVYLGMSDKFDISNTFLVHRFKIPSFFCVMSSAHRVIILTSS